MFPYAKLPNMRESRLLNKIGGRPSSIVDVNRKLAEVYQHPDSAAKAMSYAVPKEITDRVLEVIMGKRPMGKYQGAETCATLYKHLADPRVCWTLKSIALNVLLVQEETAYEWLRKYPELQYALAAGRSIQEANFGSMLLHGFKYSSGVEYILTNLHSWTAKQKTEHAIDLNAAIAAQEAARKPAIERWNDTTAPGLIRAREAQKVDQVRIPEVVNDDIDF